ncbi:MAG: lipopolysaccharide biosynthesis protein [Thalassotalea sp.]|nr:lipopolysaccharide biosynthesis protein [Thalassotalea sp.]
MKNIEQLETKFEQFKESTSKDEWASPEFLRDEAIDVENKNLELAYMIMQRANLLKPQGPFIAKKLQDYKIELQSKKSYIFVSEKSDVVKSKESKKLIIESSSYQQINVYWAKIPGWLKSKISIFVTWPLLIFALYMIFLASPRYESQSQLIVRQPDNMATLDASMAILSGLGMPTSNTDTQLAEAYIFSNDMILYLEKEIAIKEHYSNIDNDFFSRFNDWKSREDFILYYQDKITIEIDDVSSVITVKTQAFTQDYAKIINDKIITRAEWYINDVGHQIAQEQLKFVQGEHNLVASRLKAAKKELLDFQREHNLLDPLAEGIAYQQIAYTIEGQISAKKTELYALQATMSENSPKLQSTKRVIEALENQLEAENSRLSGNAKTSGLTVGEKAAKFSDLKIELELSLQSYASSLVSLEKSRIEAYRQLQFLVVVETPTTPEDNKYPEVIYNLTLFAVILLMVFGLGNIIVATIKELN